MTERLRAVFDTNVFMSAFLSRHPSSPTQELIQRWLNDEFTLLVCDALLDEVLEKLIECEIDQADIIEWATLLARLAEWVDVPAERIDRIVPDDADDDVILACAAVGGADYLVTYDRHFEPLGGAYKGIRITNALPFLWAVRGDRPLPNP